jgi:hypothetical protein
MEIDVRCDIDRALKGLALFQKDIDRAAKAALNKVGVTARAEAARAISKATGIKVNEVRTHVPLAKASGQGLTVEISAKPWSPNLIRYSARQTAQGVTANAWGRGRKLYRGTFIANKGRTVFSRVGKERTPLKPIRAGSVRKQFMREQTVKAIETTVAVRFPLEFGRAINALMQRGR